MRGSLNSVSRKIKTSLAGTRPSCASGVHPARCRLAALSRSAAEEDLRELDRALDRLFRAGRYWVPQWYKATHWIAFWDVFGQPATKPRYARGVPETWWYDRDKAAKNQRAG